MVLNGHGHHVQKDDDHNEDVKLLTSRQLEKPELNLDLCAVEQKKMSWIT